MVVPEGEDVDEVRREGFKEWNGFIYVCLEAELGVYILVLEVSRP